MESVLSHGRRAEIRIDAVLEDVTERVALPLHGKGVGVHCYVDPAIPPLQGDAERLRRACTCLLRDAVTSTTHGHVVARAFPIELGERDVTLRFEVQDTGSGNAGRGLRTAKRLVERMGGELGARSAPGSGSLVWFTARFERSPKALAPIARPFAGTAGLIVATDDTFASIVGGYAMSWGMTIHRAVSHADVLAIASEHDLVDGIAIVDRDHTSQPEHRHLTLVLIYALHGRVIEIGAGTLRKPLRRSMLFDAIATTKAFVPPDPSIPLRELAGRSRR